MPIHSIDVYGDLCRPVSLPRDGPPDLTDAWPAHCWWYYVERAVETERRYPVRAEFYRQCYWVLKRIEKMRPEWPHVRRHQLALRIVERRLRQVEGPARYLLTVRPLKRPGRQLQRYLPKLGLSDRVIGQRVRALRKAAGISQMELGEKAGLDHTYIGSVERGERNLSIEAIDKLAQGLDINIAELFRFSSKSLPVTNPHLVELVTLLEQKDAASRYALEFVKAMLQWNEEGRRR